MIRARDLTRSLLKAACLAPRAHLSAALLLLGSVSVGLAEDKKPKRPPAAPPVANAIPADTCAQARGSVRLEAYGYTHVVTLHNGCEKPVECALWSDVDPEPRTTVRAAPGESVEIITRRGSPAREVVGQKSCRFR